MPTETIVMAYLTSGATSTDIALPDGKETPIWDFVVYPPASEKFHSPYVSIRPVSPSNGAYAYYEVELLLAPLTIHNTNSVRVTLLVNIYSDNVYVYQQKMTIEAESFFPIYFGAQALGYVDNTPQTPGMPVLVTMTPAGGKLFCIRDTKGNATARPGKTYPAVTGAGVHLLPME